MATRKTYEAECSLLTTTKALLKKDTRTILELSEQSGLPFYWLQKLSTTNSLKDPSVNRIQYLYEFLTKTNLSV